MKKSILINCLKYGLGLALLAYVVWSNWPGLCTVWQKCVYEDQPVHYGLLALAGCICVVGVFLTYVRWYVLVRAQGLPFTLPNAVRLGLIGYFLSNFLPSSIGGDIFKAAFIAREQSRRTVAVATVVVDRLVGLWGLFWLGALVGGTTWACGYLTGNAAETLKTIVLVFIGLVGASMAAWLVMGVLPSRRADIFAGRLDRIPKVGHSLAELWRAVWMYRCQGRSVALAVILAVIGHVGFVMAFFLAARTLFPADQVPSLVEHYVIVPIGMTIQAGVPVPGGLGAGEFAFDQLYILIGYPRGNGLITCMVQRLITWTLSLMGYIVYLRMRPALARTQQTGSPEEEAGEEDYLAGQEIETGGRPQLISEP